MPTVTAEDALAELKARGVDPKNPPAQPDTSKIDRASALAELQRRGVQTPQSQNASSLPSYATSAQQQQYPISSMMAKGLGVGLEGLSAPFQAVGEPIRQAITAAQGQDPGKYRIPTILQRLMPSMQTKQQAPDMFSALVNPASAGIKGIAATVANLPKGIQPALQAGEQAVKQPPGAPEAALSMGAALGSGEAGALPFTAAIKPFAAIGKLLETGEMAGIPGTGMLGKAASGADAVPLGLENLTAHMNPEVQAAATKGNVPVTPGMLTGSPTLNAIESFGKKIPFSSNIFQKRFGQIYDAMENMRQPIVETSKPIADLGLDVQQGLSNATNASMGKASALFSNAENTLPQGAQIPLNNIAIKSSELLKAQLKLPPSSRTPGLAGFLYDLLPIQEKAELVKTPEVIQKLSLTPEQVSQAKELLSEPSKPPVIKNPQFDYQTVQAMRSNINSRIAQANTALGSASPGASFQSSPEARVYGQLKDALDKDLNSFSDKTGGAFKSAYSEANNTYKTYKDTYKNDKFVQSILHEQNPENVVNKVISAAKNNPRALGTLKLNLPTQTLNDLQTYFIKDMSEKDPNIFSPSKFASQYDSIGEKQLTTILGPEKMAELRPLYVLSKAGSNAEKSGQMASGPSGAGMSSAMFLRAPVSAAIGGAALGHPIKGALAGAAMMGAEMEGLPMLAKAYLSGPATKVLTRQIGMVPSFPQTGAVTQAAAKTSLPIETLIDELKKKYESRRKF